MLKSGNEKVTKKWRSQCNFHATLHGKFDSNTSFYTDKGKHFKQLLITTFKTWSIISGAPILKQDWCFNHFSCTHRPYSEQHHDRYESEAVRDRLTVFPMASAVKS